MGILDFYAIKTEALGSVPPGIKRFIDSFFQEREIFGIPCVVTLGCGSKSPWDDMDYDDNDYLEGLTEDEIENDGVFSWFRNHPEIVFNYNWDSI